MKTKNDPAYPLIDKRWDKDIDREIEMVRPGITKLEYFAGLAMQGMCALNEDGKLTYPWTIIASDSFDIAEAMVKESEKRSKC